MDELLAYLDSLPIGGKVKIIVNADGALRIRAKVGSFHRKQAKRFKCHWLVKRRQLSDLSERNARYHERLADLRTLVITRLA